MHRRGLIFGVAVGMVACNLLSGAGDLGVCEGALCSSATPGTTPTTEDASAPAVASDASITPDAQEGDPCSLEKPECAGRSVARCIDGRLDLEPCPEACADGACVPWPSCRTADASCGALGTSCCASHAIPGGTYNRASSTSHPTTVSAFALDTFEVTVGRFRAFVDAGGGTRATPPADGVGAHPKITGSGWLAAWNPELPADAAGLRELLAGGTWTDEPGANEKKPVTNVPWHVAFAFCAWDGGRLPTYAEWGFAAAGGDEQRVYPWSSPPESTSIDATRAAYGCAVAAPPYTCPPPKCSSTGTSPCDPTVCLAYGGTCQAQPCYGCDVTTDIADVGALPSGAGRWGTLDLAGNVSELVLDAVARLGAAAIEEMPPTCVDCAPLMGPSPRNEEPGGSDDYRVLVVGGSWSDEASALQTTIRTTARFDERSTTRGFRCARD